MLLKALSFIVVIQVVAISGYPQEFMIKNKKSGMVLDGTKQKINITGWAHKNSQLWTIEFSSIPGYYIISNVANRKALDASPLTKALSTYPKHGKRTQRWKLTTIDETRFQVQRHPNDFMIQKNDKVVLGPKQNDDSDKWILVVAHSV
ncbi:uncharacterized protein LOC108908498 [Anoplophora glabripennis]|uniref:uncharacterized protein LOC108908498 n=1 Tax=Anoplophora glabripennis TaxID=217634 RepID=UPI0008745A14|nr:uncharacterized protein LOC108908498 [Anoplophora glabripennis]